MQTDMYLARPKTLKTIACINSFMPNAISHLYQLNESISNLKAIW